MFENISNNLSNAVETFNPYVAISIFLFYILIDALYAKYTIDVSNLKEYRAANASVITYVLTAYGIISYTQNWLYIFPLVAGAWIGTVYMIKREKKNHK